MQTIESGGRTIRISVAEPGSPGQLSANRAPALLLLHGAGGNIPFWFDRIAPPLTALGFIVYAVHYFDRTATTRAELAILRDGVHIPEWLDALRDTLAHIAANPRVDPERIALLGISLGGFLALALATETLPGVTFASVVAVSGGLVSPWREQATESFPPTLIVHGDRDTIVAVAQAHALAARLAELNVPHSLEILPGETHWFTPRAQLHILERTAQFLLQTLTAAPVAAS